MIISGVFIPDAGAQPGWDMRLIYPKGPIQLEKLRVGDTFYYDESVHGKDSPGWELMYEKGNHTKLAKHYHECNSHRLPLFVWLPGKHLFCLDAMCWDGDNSYGGWQVSGKAPHITVSPSVDIEGVFKGYITKGHITCDMEGRLFDPKGKTLRSQESC